MAIPKIKSYQEISPDAYPENKVNWGIDSKRAVLLIHDMQNYFLNFYGDDSLLIKQLIENVKSLKAACVNAEIPVVYTAQPVNQSDDDRGLLKDMWGPGLTKAPEEYPIADDIAPSADDMVMTKWRYSAFQRSELEDWMKSINRDQLIISGVYAHIGIMTSAVDAFMRDIQAFLIADATADFSREEHEFALHFVAQRCGVVKSLQSALTILNSEQRKDSEDKTISFDALRTRILNYIDCEQDEFEAGEELANYGIDSMQVMALHADYQKLGVEWTLADISENLTLNGLWGLIEPQIT